MILNMQPAQLLTAVLLAAGTTATRVSYDTGYDDASRPLASVSCSDGVNGIITRFHWQTQGQVTNFPYIGGVQGIEWNSTTCGTCHRLEYGGRSIHILAIDAAYDGGYNIALDALNNLTDGHAEEWGHVDAMATQVPVQECGLSTAS
ncbi:Epl1/Sm1 [Trichoderma parareesei]|uniref:Epl1/Sm1 n=1 Tax=Trichoderma parareesei TaxID=858221 RepID=A0A2H2ZVH8_TRIPA|nr:Epl1/Sm1 [Trichoderma parareesei]